MNPFNGYARFALPTLSIAAVSMACTEQPPMIEGTVAISPELVPKIAPTAALFIIARPGTASAGMPLAVQRVTQPFKFPVEFRLTAADLMVPDAKFEGPVALTVRLSQSGSATPSPGDIESSGEAVSTEVDAGKPLSIRLDRVRP